MSLSIISFTENGMCLSERIFESLTAKKEAVSLFTKCSLMKEGLTSTNVQYVEEGIREWTKGQMMAGHALLFIGACGIAVRAIAPCITDKLHDSPVLVMDERGEYIIPILSGHMGGANELAREIASITKAVLVITTATDLNEKFAVDIFAKKNGLHVVNKDGIAKVSSKVLAGRELTMAIEPGHLMETVRQPKEIKIVSYPPMQPVDILITTKETDCQTLITLKPREYVIGMGCKKGKSAEKIENLIDRTMEENGINSNQIFALASIEQKKEEEGFLIWSRKKGVPFLTFLAHELQMVEGNFNASDFVKKQVGVDNVCERAALRACEGEGRLICEKHAEDGMTIAIAKREWRVSFEEE